MKPPTNLMTLGVLGENVAWGDLATLLPLAQLLHQPENATIVSIKLDVVQLCENLMIMLSH